MSKSSLLVKAIYALKTEGSNGFIDTIVNNSDIRDIVSYKNKLSELKNTSSKVKKYYIQSILDKGVTDEYEFVNQLNAIKNLETYYKDITDESTYNVQYSDSDNSCYAEDSDDKSEGLHGYTLRKFAYEIINNMEADIISNHPKFIFISGKECSGKTSVVEYIRNYFLEKDVALFDATAMIGDNSYSTDKINILICDDFDIIKHTANDRKYFLSTIVAKSKLLKVSILPVVVVKESPGTLASLYNGELYTIPKLKREDLSCILNSYRITYSIRDKEEYIKLSKESINDIIKPLYSYNIDNKLKLSIEVYKKLCSDTILSRKEQNRYTDNIVLHVEKKRILNIISKHLDIEIKLNYDEISAEIYDFISSRIIGQNDVIDTLLPTLTSIKMGILSPNKPAGVFYLYGPTGTGKSEIGKVIADYMYNGNCYKEDMNTFKDSISINRLLGSPPAYLGHDNDPGIVKFISSHKGGVIILDEIEKANSDIIDSLMEVFDTGKFVDSRSNRYNLNNFIIILTSNITFENKSPTVGFVENKSKLLSNRDEIKRTNKFKPEFMARITEFIKYNEITKEHLDKIARLLLDDVINTISYSTNINSYTEEDVKAVVDSYVRDQGVRSMKYFASTYILKKIRR